MTARRGLRFAALGYLALLLIVPVGLVVYRTFEPGIGEVWDSITTPAAVSAFWLTLEIAAISVVLNTVLGVVAVTWRRRVLVLAGGAGFALAWGAFPLLTGYFACAGTISWEALLAACYAALTSYVQRVLSTPVRHVRRRVAAVAGTIELRDGGREPVTRDSLAATQERSLQLLAAANVSLAVALLVFRLT